MKELERRDFAKQTLRWGGALTLLTVLNPPRAALGAGPGSGKSTEGHAKEPLLAEG